MTGGRAPIGGIFWLDWDVLRAAAGGERRQIVGHTPRPAPELAGTQLWCVDVGAALSGEVCAITRQGQRGRWRPVTHPSAGQVRRSAPGDGPGGRPERPAGL
jgi:hypothetical protein